MIKKVLSVVVIMSMVIMMSFSVSAEESCNHNYVVEGYDVLTHTEKCTLCGKIIETNHIWGDYSLVTNDAMNHHSECIVCGQEHTQSHSWYSDGKLYLLFSAASCDGCNTKKVLESAIGFKPYDGTADQSTCTHNWGVQYYDNDVHTLVCHSCGAVQEGTHEWKAGAKAFEEVCTGGCVRKTYPTEWQYQIEAKYSLIGSYDVRSITYTADEGLAELTEHKFWYPAEMETSDSVYPVIVFSNGTGSSYVTGKTDYLAYNELFEHLASWGFIVATNDDTSSGKGDSANASLAKLISLSADETSVFYNKVDTENIGAAGHSQGGAGTFNFATSGKYEYSHMVKAICPISAPDQYTAKTFISSDYDTIQVKVPTFLIAGTGTTEDSGDGTNGLCRLEDSLKPNFTNIDSTVIMARRCEAEHSDMVTAGKGYMVAWFRYLLMGDTYAAQAFVGENPEIFQNSFWQDQASK